MTAVIQPLTVISQRARDVLIRELGVTDAIRFLNQFQMGSGDYTRGREQLFTHVTVKSIVSAIKMQRKSQL